MSLGHETGTPTLEPERQAEPQLLYIANDENFQATGNKDRWHEIAVIDNGDNTRTLQVGRWNIGSEQKPFEGATDYNGKESEGSYLAVDYFVAEDLYKVVGGKAEDAIQVLGYDIKKGHDSYFITYLVPVAKNQRLQWIRELTGYAPHVKVGHEGLYAYREQADALDENAILVSSSPEDEEHDTINHVLAYELLAPSTFQLIAQRTRQVVTKLDTTPNDTPGTPSDEFKDAQQTYKEHFEDLEKYMSRRFVNALSNYLGSNDETTREYAEHNLIIALKEVLFGDTYDREKHRAIVLEEMEKTVERVRTLAELKQRLPERVSA